MKIKHLKQTLRKTKHILLGIILVSTVGGIIAYFIPKKYVATGTIYITRKPDTTQEQYYKYGGYYNQQTAINYTYSVMALLQTKDTERNILERTSIEPTYRNLRKLERNMSIKSKGNQVIEISIKDKNEQRAISLWNNTKAEIMELSNYINNKGDTNLKVVPTTDTPVIYTRDYGVYTYGLMGTLVGFVLAGIWLGIKSL